MNKLQLNFYFPPVAIVLLTYLIFTFLLLYKNNFDFSRLIVIGDMFSISEKLPQNISYLENSAGYDGEFYFRLALNPFTNKVEDYGIILDVPSYRQQRIMYPALVWILSLGKSEIVPFMMLFVNLLGISILAVLGSYFVKLLKLNPFWGILFALYPGFLYSLSASLAEIIQTTFLLSALILLSKQKNLYGAIFLTLAVLTRETSLIIPFCILIFSKIRRFMFIPLATFLIFQIILFIVWGEFPFSSKSSAFSLPFFGLISFITNLVNQANPPRIFFLQLGFLFTFATGALVALKLAKIEKYIKFSFISYAFLALSFSTLIWVEDKAFLRSLNEFYFLGIVILLSAKKFLKYIFAFTTLIFIATLIHII